MAVSVPHTVISSKNSIFQTQNTVYFSATKFGDSYKDIMNLSDLVHRTAGDNKVLTTSKPSCNIRTSNSLFQQGPSTTNNGIETSSFLFSMPNVTPVKLIYCVLCFFNSFIYIFIFYRLNG